MLFFAFEIDLACGDEDYVYLLLLHVSLHHAFCLGEFQCHHINELARVVVCLVGMRVANSQLNSHRL